MIIREREREREREMREKRESNEQPLICMTGRIFDSKTYNQKLAIYELIVVLLHLPFNNRSAYCFLMGLLQVFMLVE